MTIGIESVSLTLKKCNLSTKAQEEKQMCLGKKTYLAKFKLQNNFTLILGRDVKIK